MKHARFGQVSVGRVYICILITSWYQILAIDRTELFISCIKAQFNFPGQHTRTHTQTRTSRRTFQRRIRRGEVINSDHKHVLRSLESGIECAAAHIVLILRSQVVGAEVGTTGTRRVVSVAVAAEVGKRHTADSDK